MYIGYFKAILKKQTHSKKIPPPKTNIALTVSIKQTILFQLKMKYLSKIFNKYYILRDRNLIAVAH